MTDFSPKAKALLATRNLDTDKAIALLRIQEWQLSGKNDQEIAKAIMQAAEQQQGLLKEAELIKIILRESLKDLAPTEEEVLQEIQENESFWR